MSSTTRAETLMIKSADKKESRARRDREMEHAKQFRMYLGGTRSDLDPYLSRILARIDKRSIGLCWIFTGANDYPVRMTVASIAGFYAEARRQLEVTAQWLVKIRYDRADPTYVRFFALAVFCSVHANEDAVALTLQFAKHGPGFGKRREVLPRFMARVLAVVKPGKHEARLPRITPANHGGKMPKSLLIIWSE
jgi:hypothetical protein